MAAPHLPKAGIASPGSSRTDGQMDPRCPALGQVNCGQTTVPALEPARLRAAVAHGANARLPGCKGTGATRQHHAALCPASPGL